MKPTQMTPMVILNSASLDQAELQEELEKLSQLGQSIFAQDPSLIDFDQMMRDGQKALEHLDKFGK